MYKKLRGSSIVMITILFQKLIYDIVLITKFTMLFHYLNYDTGTGTPCMHLSSFWNDMIYYCGFTFFDVLGSGILVEFAQQRFDGKKLRKFFRLCSNFVRIRSNFGVKNFFSGFRTEASLQNLYHLAAAQKFYQKEFFKTLTKR